MCFPSCCSSTCCKVIYYICLAIVFIYLILCVLLIPQYRYVALMVIAVVVLYATSAWRLLPSERSVVRERAEVLARQQCPPPAEAVTYPHCPTSSTTPAVRFHEPFTSEVRAP
ncbi:hypothetical protein ABB37_01591 [Leptomonas pyrrhocoris]|uniref:Uncharacterized protein n=1 Tax=Leptomonas pyrrhocoris TaxID=157538 RepID=A0A0M9G9C2_LEPPY|nr:hypothetical protein ABB37_01591 [Leptomonas pyrrhocoris]KPA85239.1 hypothetical protein ABB37_01591 [Leptomonas pyrrhocoris]|eukprot:XP_015663678.1 hypothetical protein ABB37_01591 [Leptomonas pyrrhocoris]